MLGWTIPLIGFAAFLIAYLLRARRSAEIALMMALLNVSCTLAQKLTGQMMLISIFVSACVIAAAYLLGNILWRGGGKLEMVLIGLVSLNAAIYGSYFFFPDIMSEPWRIAGNLVILAIYSLIAGGAVHEHYIHGAFSRYGGCGSLLDHSRGMAASERQKGKK